VNSFSILYIGRSSGTSLHRLEALRRLGHSVFSIDPHAYLPKTRLTGMWTWHTGGLLLERYIRHRVISDVPKIVFDLVYVDCGELVGPFLVKKLQERFGTIINYNVDDPYGPRDGGRWRLYLQAVPIYDLIIVVRDSNIAEAFAQGARSVLRVHRSADEIAHSPRPINDQDRRKWTTEVAFVGTWMPERGSFMARLIELRVPLAIYGDRWQKAPEWALLRPYWRGPGLYNDDDYAKAIQYAKVNLGLISKGNRDLTTQRSFEIPYMKGVLCAERTAEHTGLYREDEEAVFWSSPEECASKCMQLLNDEQRRQRIAVNGRRRCVQNSTTNEAVLDKIVDKALGRSDRRCDGRQTISAHDFGGVVKRLPEVG